VKRILIVEDDASLQKLLCRALESAGLSAVAIADGIEALNQIRRERFDLVLLDLGLPGMHGLDIMKHLQEEESPPKVIVMTGDGAPETVLSAVQRQAYRYLVKPFEMNILLEIVRAALAAESLPATIELLSAKPEWVELRVPCDLESVDRILGFLQHLDADLPLHTRESIGRAFRELLLNAIEWGGKLDPSRKVRISYLRAHRMLMYRIADPGPGFCTDALPHAALRNPQENPLEHMDVRAEMGLRPGGFGILLAQAMVDELIYNEARNEVVFIKYLD
jgi:CheY-like chemotaxis protein/anti-sigma regulatory factor (Ser/Thr protein kinase)